MSRVRLRTWNSAVLHAKQASEPGAGPGNDVVELRPKRYGRKCPSPPQTPDELTYDILCHEVLARMVGSLNASAERRLGMRFGDAHSAGTGRA